MAQPELTPTRLKVVRVITASYVVPWHLANTLARMPADFEVCVVGQDVSSYRDSYPDTIWVDINIDRKINLFSDLIALYELCRFLVSWKPDIVHSIMPKAGFLSAIAGFVCRVPVRIHTFTGQIWATETGATRMFHYWLDRLINSLNTLCLTDSPSQSAFLHAHKISNSGKALPYLSRGSLSGVEVAGFDLASFAGQADQLRKELEINDGDFLFAFIARKTREKGAIDMLKAFAEVSRNHPEARLLFIGPDESGGEIAALSESSPELFRNVLSVGQVDNHKLYLAISDVLCLPSHREGFGTIVIEAAALGVPAIGSDIPGLVDSIANGRTGLLFPAGDINALATLMADFLKNPGKYEEMRAEAKARVSEFFTADLLYDELRTLYLKLAAGRSDTATNQDCRRT